MENTSKQNVSKPPDHRNERRAFFVQLVAVIGGGIIGGSFLKRILKAVHLERVADTTIKLTPHPLAVPRTREGSGSHA